MRKLAIRRAKYPIIQNLDFDILESWALVPNSNVVENVLTTLSTSSFHTCDARLMTGTVSNND